MATQETAAAERGEWPNRHSCGLGHGLRISTSPIACGCVIRGMFVPFPGSSPLQEAAVTRGEEGLLAPGGVPSACLPRHPQEWLAGPSCLCLLDLVVRADCCAVRLVLPDLQARKQHRPGLSHTEVRAGLAAPGPALLCEWTGWTIFRTVRSEWPWPPSQAHAAQEAIHISFHRPQSKMNFRSFSPGGTKAKK